MMPEAMAGETLQSSINTLTRRHPETSPIYPSGRGNLRNKLTTLYGEPTYLNTRKLDKLRTTKSRLLSNLAFLRRCRASNILPNFVRIRHHIQTRASSRILAKAEQALVKERVRDTYYRLHNISRQITNLEQNLVHTLTEDDYHHVDNITSRHAENILRLCTERQKAKFDKLLRLQKPSNPDNHPGTINTVVNLSDKHLNPAEKSILNKGLNFAMAPSKIPKEEIISEVEASIRLMPLDDAEDIRRETSRILHRAKPPKNNITKEEKLALRSLREDKDIMIVKADKGNATVVLNIDDYKSKVSQLLEPATYRPISKDPTNSIELKTRSLIKRSFIPPEQHRNILPSSSKPPRFYGLPKIHKPGVPFRPIVSTIGSPTYELSRYLAKELRPYVGNSERYIRNSPHFVEKLREINIERTDILVSFDVESLFTSVPVTDVVDLMSTKLVPLGLNKEIPDLVKFCLSTTYFMWDKKFYEQIQGAPMGSPLSPVVADIFMEHLEQQAIDSSTLKPKCWFRYVDDTFVVWPHGEHTLDDFLNHLNSQHPAIKFTIEKENNKQLPFLDVLVKRPTPDSLDFMVYRKPTHTDRYLHAQSHHHPKQKRSVIHSLVHRAKTICDAAYLPDELMYVKDALSKNGYGNVDTVRWAQRVVVGQGRYANTSNSNGVVPAGFACLPYIAGVTDRITKILHRHNIKVRHRTLEKVCQVLPTNKDPLPRLHTEGVYCIPCSCGSSYIGQTGRSIACRLKEHQRDVRQIKTERSAVAEHVCRRGNHNVNWDDVKVLARTSKYYPRVIREAIEIFKTPDNFNREDGYRLSHTWHSVFSER